MQMNVVLQYICMEVCTVSEEKRCSSLRLKEELEGERQDLPRLYSPRARSFAANQVLLQLSSETGTETKEGHTERNNVRRYSNLEQELTSVQSESDCDVVSDAYASSVLRGGARAFPSIVCAEDEALWALLSREE